MSASRRKAAAVRAPSSLRHETSMSLGDGDGAAAGPSTVDAGRLAQQKALLVAASQTHHNLPPAMFSSPALQSLIYATSNDRYPGAPGTLLHRAKLEAARALAASKREAQREAERRDEMKRLGIASVGANRKRVGNGHAEGTANGSGPSNGRSSRFNTPPGNERTRRNAANATAASAAAANGNINGLSNGTAQHVASSGSSSSSSSSQARNGRAAANGRNLGNAIDPNTLPVPGSATTTQSSAAAENGPSAPSSSPLLSSSGRLRRPANGSRGASPMPLTGPPGPRGGRSPGVNSLDYAEAHAGNGSEGGVDPLVPGL